MTTKQKRTVAGIKGFALCLILFYMAFSQIFVGGHLGYQLLFALSGYLTFDLYIKERIYPGPFFVEKVRALWPELIGMVTITTAVYAIFFSKDLPLVRGQALSAVFFVNNLFQGFHGHPLSIHQPSPFGHLWFISLLMQCYFIFALVIMGKKTKQKIISVAFILTALSVVSALLLGLYGGLDLSESRIFYMPDSRLFSFFIAVPVAAYGVFSKKELRVETREIGMLGIMILFVIFILFMPEENLAYFGGLVFSGILLSIFLFLLFRGETTFESVFHFPLFTFIGDRSYSFYLYSMPVFFFMRKLAERTGLNAIVATWIGIVLLLFVGQASYYFFKKRQVVKTKVLLAMCGILGIILALSFYSQATEVMKSTKKEKQVVKTVESETAKKKEEVSITEKFKPSDELAAAIEQVNAQQPKYKLTNDDLGKLQNIEGILLGDSAARAARESYLKLMPSLRIHGDSNLTPAWYVEQVQDYHGEGPVILQLGNDIKLDYNNVKTIVEAGDGKPIYFISVVTPNDFEENNNKILHQIADHYKNVNIVDWYKEAKVQSDFFDEEGQMNQPATRLMAHMLGHSLLYNKPTVTNGGDEDTKESKSKTTTESNLSLGEDDRGSGIKEPK